MLDVSKFTKAQILAALYNHSQTQGMGVLHHTPEVMTVAKAQSILDTGQTYFDYLKGRVMKVEIGEKTLNPNLYDRDNGEGAAAHALKQIKTI